MKCYRLCELEASSGRRPPGPWPSTKKGKGSTGPQPNCWRPCWNGATTLFSPMRRWSKPHEHQFRNPEQALHYVRQALLLLAEPKLHKDEAVQEKQNELQYRYARLRRKLRQESSAL
ncbi:MAG: hypothetical protein ACLUE8_15895 [Lachnospiraceae bacterium]